MIKKAVSKDERAWFFSSKEKRAKTVSERIFRAGENLRVFVSTDLILAKGSEAKKNGGTPVISLMAIDIFPDIVYILASYGLATPKK
jgi:hypothetical protein